METNKLGTVRTLLRIFPYAKKALPRIVLGTIAAILGHMFALAIPGYLRSLFDTLESNTTFDTLLFAVFAVLGMGLLEAVMVLLRRWLVLTPGTHVEAGLRRALYAKLQDLEVAFHDKWPSGQLLSRASSEVSLFCSHTTGYLRQCSSLLCRHYGFLGLDSKRNTTSLLV